MMKKITMQNIADALSTSRITVWKALSNRPGVSARLRSEIQQKAKEMGYLADDAEYPSLTNPVPCTIAAVVSRPESSSFWMEIIHQLAKSLSEQGINLMYTYLPAHYKEGYSLPSVLTDGSVSGMIVLNVYSGAFLEMLSAVSLPKVFLDTVPEISFEKLGGNLVILEGKRAVQKITACLLDSGRTRLSFIGDITYAQTNLDRYHGFVEAFKEKKSTPDLSMSLLGPFGLHTHNEQISHFIQGFEELPDAFVCASDYVADLVQTCLTEQGMNTDGKTIMTGFDNNMECAGVAGQITTVDVKTKMLGARLANQILFAVKHPSASRELSYVFSEVLYRGVLSEEEIK